MPGPSIQPRAAPSLRRASAAAASGRSAESSTTLCAISASASNSFMAKTRGLRHHRMRGRSATARGSTTGGTSTRAASDAVISTCSQQICRRCPKGIQHCAYTRSSSAAPPAPLSRMRMVRAGCSGMSAAMISPRAAASSPASLTTTRVMEQARSTPWAPSVCPSWPCETHRAASARRILSGASVPITASSRCAPGGSASHRRRPAPRRLRDSWESRISRCAIRSVWARRRSNWPPPCPAAYTAWHRR